MRKIFLAICCLFLFLFNFRFDFAKNELRLNEIVACNHTVLYDNTGKYHDYIEIYNEASIPVDISGYHLSDSKKKLTRYTFPENTVIAPQQYYLVWADEKPDNILVDNNYLYTGFSVKGGEKIYFSDTQGNIIDKVKVPKDIACNMSYSHIPYVNKWAKREPTPGRQNKLYGKRKVKVLPDVKVKFDAPSGFYDESFELKMSAPEGFDIYYTLDATRPDKRSKKYVAPIEIRNMSYEPNRYSAIYEISIAWPYAPRYKVDKATVVRAVAIRRYDGAISGISEASYFVGFQGRPEYQGISAIFIITDPENLFDYERGIYVRGKIWDMLGGNLSQSYSITTNYSKNNRKDWAREMTAEYTKDGKTSRLSGKMRIMGGYSRHWPQKSFTLFDLQEEDKKEKPLFEFDLRAINQFYRIKESMVYKLTADRKEILAHPPEDFVNLFLDGEYWGTYFVYSRLTPEFVMEKTGLKDPSLIDMQRNDKIYGNTWFQPEYESYEEVKRAINIDSLITYLAINTYIDNRDACNFEDWNVVRWRSSENSDFNKWQWILYDLDNDNITHDNNSFAKQERCNLIAGNEFLEKLFTVEDFKKKFVVTFQDLANYNFDPQKVNEFLYSFNSKYKYAMIENFRRFVKDTYYEGNYEYWINTIKDFFDRRFEYIMPYMKEYFNLQGKLVEIYKFPSTVKGGKVLFNTLNLAADEWYIGQYYSDYDVALDVETFPGYVFKGWLIDDQLVKTQKLNLNISHPRTIEALWERKGDAVEENKL